MEKVDVVIPTMGEPSLRCCVDSIRKNMAVNKLILVAPKILDSLVQFPDIEWIICDERNVGKKRALGLKRVTTPYYASIDSDVLITRKWYNWCMATIRRKGVGACEGFPQDLGKYYPKILLDSIRNGGHAGLGNTMLKTSVVRMVGMPENRYGEDWELRLRIERTGNKWIMNENVICYHLKSDVDVLKSDAKWAEIAGKEALNPLDCLRAIGWTFTKCILKYNSPGVCLFAFCNQLFLLYGYWKGVIKRKLSSLQR